MKGSDLIFDCINLQHDKCHKKSELRWIIIDSPDWIKNKKATINFINYNDKSFQLARTVALNHKEIGKNYKYNWEEISYLL